MRPWSVLLGLMVGCEPSVRDAPKGADAAATPPVGESSPASDTLPVGTELLADEALLRAVSQALATAERRVQVAHYTLWDSGVVRDLLDAAGDAAERGVRVQVLADEEAEDAAALVEELLARGVEARLDSPEVTLHNKLWIIDDSVLTGSHNLSNSAMTSNREVSVRVTDAAAVASFGSWFEAVWEEPGVNPVLPALEGSTRTYFDDRVLEGVLDCIDSSASSLRVAMYAFSWSTDYPGGEVDQVMESLVRAHARGVDVRVVLDGSSWIADNDINTRAIAHLRGEGVPVRIADNARLVHAKAMVCDGTAFVSDANWSYSGLVRYHGASVAIDGARVAEPLAEWIDGLWEAGQAP